MMRIIPSKVKKLDYQIVREKIGKGISFYSEGIEYRFRIKDNPYCRDINESLVNLYNSSKDDKEFIDKMKESYICYYNSNESYIDYLDIDRIKDTKDFDSSFYTIDRNTTNMPYYDYFLSDSGNEYMQRYRHRLGIIKELTYDEYVQKVVDYIYGTSIEDYYAGLDANKVDEWLTQSIKQYPLPVIDFADKTQEGRHRLHALNKQFNDPNKRYPVLLVYQCD